ncbi:MAG: hypothetical protein EA416_05370 [Trueperaceae bacterium]|nr:MAG: hypothetical protein EA416_05370 [Trueperaceae bacterium]
MRHTRARPLRTYAALALALALAACGGPGGGGGPDPQPGPQEFTLIDQFPSPESRVGDRFSTGLALRGDLLVAGAPYAAGVSAGAAGAGAAWPFLLGGTPAPGTRFASATGMNNDTFGTAVAIDGAYTFVGVPGADDDRGSVFVYRREGDAFTLVTTLAEPSRSVNAKFGNRIAAHGGRVLIAAPGKPDGVGRRGVAHVFEREGEDFVYRQILQLPVGVDDDDGIIDRFGTAVALRGDVAVVTSLATNRAYVYEFAAGSWSHVTTLGGASEHEARRFGQSVAIGADVMFVGAPAGESPGFEHGRVYVYARGSGGWTSAYQFFTDTGVTAWYGYAVATDGTRLVVGAPTAVIGGVSGAGAAFVYGIEGNEVSGTYQRLTALGPTSDARFGAFVAIDGNRIAVAVPRRTISGEPPGEVAVFER